MSDSPLPSAWDRIQHASRSQDASVGLSMGWSVSLHIWAVLSAKLASGQRVCLHHRAGQLCLSGDKVKYTVMFVLVLRPEEGV